MLLPPQQITDCPPEKAFWCTDGTILRNVHDVLNYVEGANEFSFRYHVNEDHNKNDFADWIRDVFADIDLADQLEGVMNQKKYAAILKKWISTA